MLTSNVQPRRIVKHHTSDKGQRCAACGVRGFVASQALPFCMNCMDWTKQRNLVEWDDLGGGD